MSETSEKKDKDHKTTVSLWVPVSTKKLLEAEADATGKSMNAIINEALDKYFKATK